MLTRHFVKSVGPCCTSSAMLLIAIYPSSPTVKRYPQKMKRNRSRKRNSPGKARTSDPRQVSLDQCEFNPQGLFLTLVRA